MSRGRGSERVPLEVRCGSWLAEPVRLMSVGSLAPWTPEGEALLDEVEGRLTATFAGSTWLLERRDGEFAILPRLADPRDVAERSAVARLLMAGLADTGLAIRRRLVLVDWAVLPVLGAVRAASSCLVQGSHRLSRSEQEARHAAVRAARLPLLAPWLDGTEAVADRAAFAAFHTTLPYLETVLLRELMESSRPRPSARLRACSRLPPHE